MKARSTTESWMEGEPSGLGKGQSSEPDLGFRYVNAPQDISDNSPLELGFSYCVSEQLYIFLSK